MDVRVQQKMLTAMTDTHLPLCQDHRDRDPSRPDFFFQDLLRNLKNKASLFICNALIIIIKEDFREN